MSEAQELYEFMVKEMEGDNKYKDALPYTKASRVVELLAHFLAMRAQFMFKNYDGDRDSISDFSIVQLETAVRALDIAEKKAQDTPAFMEENDYDIS